MLKLLTVSTILATSLVAQESEILNIGCKIGGCTLECKDQSIRHIRELEIKIFEHNILYTYNIANYPTEKNLLILPSTSACKITGIKK